MNWLAPRLIYFIFKIFSCTWRIRLVEHPEVRAHLDAGQPLILAHWHGDELALLALVPHYRIATMISKSSDGTRMDYVIRRLGGAASRGSSSRGAISALKGLIRLGKQGHVMSIAVDGPRGPYHEPKHGVFEISRVCGAGISAFGTACTKKITSHRSWNKIFLPLPFSKIVYVLSAPMPPLAKNDDPRDISWRNGLRSALDGAQQKAGKLIADNDAEC